MEIINATNPKVTDYLEPFILEDEDFGGKERLLEMLRYMLTERADEIRVLVGFEERELKGFVIAFNAQQKPHVFLVQMWVSPGEEKLADRLFSRIVLWTDSLGKSEIRAESKRNPLVLERRWNFYHFSQIVQFTIPDDYAQRLIDIGHENIIGRYDDGQRQQARDTGDQPDPEGSPASVQGDHGGDGGGAGSGSGGESLPREPSSPSDARDVSGPPVDVSIRGDIDEGDAATGDREPAE